VHLPPDKSSLHEEFRVQKTQWILWLGNIIAMVSNVGISSSKALSQACEPMLICNTFLQDIDFRLHMTALHWRTPPDLGLCV